MTPDPATLDQLRVLLAIVETGSFSAAGRRLHRVQSAVSHAVAAMEEQFGLPLFDRSARRPTLTPTGDAVLVLARAVCDRADALRQLVDTLQRGEEAVVSVAVDLFYPCGALTAACRDFAATWPHVQLRLHTDTLGAVAALVHDGTCVFGVAGPLVDARGLVSRHLGTVRLITVAAATHPLAQARGGIPAERLAEAVQIVLSERGGTEETPDQGVLSPRTWRVHDLQTKRALLVEGLGWGNLPESLIAEDLAAGRLVPLQPEAWPAGGLPLSLSAVYRSDEPPGPAGRWLLERFARGCGIDQRSSVTSTGFETQYNGPSQVS